MNKFYMKCIYFKYINALKDKLGYKPGLQTLNFNFQKCLYIFIICALMYWLMCNGNEWKWMKMSKISFELRGWVFSNNLIILKERDIIYTFLNQQFTSFFSYYLDRWITKGWSRIGTTKYIFSSSRIRFKLF